MFAMIQTMSRSVVCVCVCVCVILRKWVALFTYFNVLLLQYNIPKKRENQTFIFPD